MMPYPESTYGVRKSNAALIAAAPEMLNALREARWTLIALYEKAYLGDGEEDSDTIDTIDLVLQAIASAEGRA